MCRPCAIAADSWGLDSDRDQFDEQLEWISSPAPRVTACRCGATVALGDLRPVVMADGTVSSRCPACVAAGPHDRLPAGEQPWTDRAPASASELPNGPPWQMAQRAGERPWRGALAVVGMAGVAFIVAQGRSGPAPTAVVHAFAPAALAADDSRGGRGRQGAVERSIVIIADSDQSGVAGDDDLSEGMPTIEDILESSGESLEELLPTLADWVHPVPGSTEAFPLDRGSRRFGARREGVDRSECGRGHCGVDLDGPRGTPVVAVAWGWVVRIERRSDRRSGKYVRIEHPDFVYTSYMHLDSIASDLEVGDEVSPGDPLGTLGRTGIAHSAPHLHFSLEIPKGSHEELRYIDPEPFLRRATRMEGVPSMAVSTSPDQDANHGDDVGSAADELPAD